MCRHCDCDSAGCDASERVGGVPLSQVALATVCSPVVRRVSFSSVGKCQFSDQGCDRAGHPDGNPPTSHRPRASLPPAQRAPVQGADPRRRPVANVTRRREETKQSRRHGESRRGGGHSVRQGRERVRGCLRGIGRSARARRRASRATRAFPPTEVSGRRRQPFFSHLCGRQTDPKRPAPHPPFPLLPTRISPCGPAQSAVT